MVLGVTSHYKSVSGLDYNQKLALVMTALDGAPDAEVSRKFVETVAAHDSGVANLEDIFFEAGDKVRRDSEAGDRPLFTPMVSQARFTATAINMISQSKGSLQLAVGMPS